MFKILLLFQGKTIKNNRNYIIRNIPLSKKRLLLFSFTKEQLLSSNCMCYLLPDPLRKPLFVCRLVTLAPHKGDKYLMVAFTCIQLSLFYRKSWGCKYFSENSANTHTHTHTLLMLWSLLTDSSDSYNLYCMCYNWPLSPETRVWYACFQHCGLQRWSLWHRTTKRSTTNNDRKITSL